MLIFHKKEAQNVIRRGLYWRAYDISNIIATLMLRYCILKSKQFSFKSVCNCSWVKEINSELSNFLHHLLFPADKS